MSWYRPSNLLDKVFEGGIILKGASGVLELLAGAILVFTSPGAIRSFLAFLTQREIAEDPNDTIANLILHSAEHFNAGNKAFAVVYLWVHAAIKLTAVVGILRNQLWAYPFSLIALGLLMLYQVFSMVVKFSVGMFLLTVFDAFILWLIWREYGKVRPALTRRAAG